jgi:hypothetical protein
MLVQLVSGDLTFFIGRYDYLIPTGISSDQHMNGLLITISYAFIQSFFIRNGRNVIAPIFFVLCLFFLVINTSRASLFAYFVTTAYIAMMTLKLKHLISLGLMFGAIFLSVDIAWENLLLIASEILPAELSIAYNAAVMKYTAFFTDESVNERLTLWASLMDLSVVDSIKILTFGLGPGSFDSLHSQTIHNTLLDVLISVGAIGLFSIGIVIFRIVRYAAYRIDRNNCFALSAVIVSIVVSSMFHDFGRTRFLWIFLGLAACCCNRQGVLNSSNP